MDKICGNCKYFKESSVTESIMGRCKNKSSRAQNKDNKSYLSKGCFWFEQDEIININEDVLLYNENDEAILNKLLFKMENEFPNKLNKRRALAIRHLIEDYKKLKIENLRNNKKE